MVESFSVVVFQFPEKPEEVAIVPRSWICEDNSSCYWPNSKVAGTKAQKWAKNGKAVGDDWEKFKIRVLRSYPNYEKARVDLPRAEASDLESQSDSSKGSYRYSAEAKRSRNISTTENPGTSTSPAGSPVSQPLASEFERYAQKMRKIDANIKKVVQEMGAANEKLDQLARASVAIEMRQKSLLEEVKVILAASTKTTRGSGDAWTVFTLPLSNQDDVSQAETELTDDENMEKFKEKLRRIGGLNYKDACRRAIREILSHEVIASFSFAGRTKTAFKVLRICRAIIDVVSEDYDVTKQQVEQVIGNTLKQHKACASE